MKRRIAMLTAGLALAATPAFAQFAPWTDRGFVNVNVGTQDKARDESSTFAFGLYEENASVGVSRNVKGGSFPDVMGGVRLWKNTGLAGQFSARSAKSDANLAGTVPDPFAYNSPRPVTSTASGLEHREQWFSIAGVYLLPLTNRLHLMMFGGPAVVKLHHDVIESATVAESSADPAITIQRSSLSRSVWGYMAGADLRFMFTAHLGVGAFARMQAAKVNLPQGGLSVETGGGQAGGGVRIGF
jgi:hypothetical protein